MPAQAPGRQQGQTRLTWWALALPVLAFAVLLTLLVGAGSAHATQEGRQAQPLQRPLPQVLRQIETTLLG